MTFNIGGIPVRAIPALIIVALGVINRPDILVNSTRALFFALAVIALTAMLGMAVTLAAGTGLSYIVGQLTEIQVQAAVGLFVCCYMVAVCGPKRLLFLFAVPICMSLLVAAAQFLSSEPAWAARGFLGQYQVEEPVTQAAYVIRDRTVDDGSATSRSVLRYFGSLLFIVKPLGYGLALIAQGITWTSGTRSSNTQMRRRHLLPSAQLSLGRVE